MSKTFLFFYFYLLLFASCHIDPPLIAPAVEVHMLTDTLPQNLTSVISYAGALEFQSVPYKITAIEDFIATPDHFIIFDSHSGAQEKIYVIDKKTGIFQKEILVPRYENGDLSGIRNVTYAPQTKTLFALGFKRIFEFNLDGTLRDIIPIEVDGNRMLALDDGNLLIESSPNEDDAAHYHHLLLLNRKGDILKRFLPYSPQGKSFLVREAGLLKKTERTILYSKPFGDTVYQLEQGTLRPMMALNFGGKEVKPTEALNLNQVLGGVLMNRAFVKSDLEKIGSLMAFSFQAPDRNTALGFYDLETGQFTNSRNTRENDGISSIMRYGKILGQDNGRLIFEMSPEHAEGLLKHHPTQMSQLKQINPYLFQTIQNIANTQTAGILYFDLSKNNKP